MLRIVTKSDTILVKSDEAGVKSVAVPGFEIPHRSQRPALGAFRKTRPGALRVRRRCAGWSGRPRQDFPQADPDRYLCRRIAGREDHAARSRDARSRGACAGARKRADALRAIAAELCDRCGVAGRHRVRARDHLGRADSERHHAAAFRRRSRGHHGGHVPGISLRNTGC